MQTIYTPKGAAREYSPRALNLFSGCDHGCLYCYNRNLPWSPKDPLVVTPRAGIVEALEKHLARHKETGQVLLSFVGDPYCKADAEPALTRRVLEVLLRHQVPVAILTKGGSRCLRDLDLFLKFEKIKVGATLVFSSGFYQNDWEPGSAEIEDRMFTLEDLKEAGIRTWVSFEPVIQPEQTLTMLGWVKNLVDEIKLGRWNHDARADKIDWKDFAEKAVALLEKGPALWYIKTGLQPFVQHLDIDPVHFDQDALSRTWNDAQTHDALPCAQKGE